MDFTDLPILGALTPADEDLRTRVLSLVRKWTLAFFDRCLRARGPALSDRAEPVEFETVRRFNTRRP